MESSLYSAEETALLRRFFGDHQADPASHLASGNVAPDTWEHTDLAIGWFTADKDVLESSGHIIRQWWQSQRDGWDQAPWVEFRCQGAVSQELATAWRTEVWFPPSDDDPDEEESDSVTVQENSYDR